MLGWLFKKPRFYRYPDTFGFKQTTVDEAVAQAISSRVACGDIVMLLCHFPKTFERFEALLNRQGLDFEIPTETIDADWLSHQTPSNGILYLTLSQMLRVDETPKELPVQKRQLSVLGIEKHPSPEADRLIERFARSTAFQAKLGYYLSFEQPLIDYCFGQNERQLLKHWTSIDDIVFASTLASRRVDAKIKSSYSHLENEKYAESIEHWLQLNYEDNE